MSNRKDYIIGYYNMSRLKHIEIYNNCYYDEVANDAKTYNGYDYEIYCLNNSNNNLDKIVGDINKCLG